MEGAPGAGGEVVPSGKTKNDGRTVGKLHREDDRLMIDGSTGEEEMSGESDEKKKRQKVR